MTMFDFVAGEGFRSSLESDYRELNVAMEARAWKAVHILAGSIIEAILIDYLVASNYKNTPRNDLLKLDLDKAISACKQENVLSEKAASLATVVRLYRNLIHPGRIERLGEKVDENGAKIAQALVAIVVDEISQRSQEKFGYTAALPIKSDSSASCTVWPIVHSTAPNRDARHNLVVRHPSF